MFEKIKDILELTTLENDQIRIERKRIEWDHIFLLEALLWSSRSHDPQTQCGCVLVRDGTVLSTGYNGFISDIDDTSLPNLRPFKYDFMIHSEANAIYNCARMGVNTNMSTAYVTGEPCNNCWQAMWQAGIWRVVYSDFNNPHMLQNDKAARIRQAIMYLFDSKMEIDFIPSKDINFSPITSIYKKFVEKKDNQGI